MSFRVRFMSSTVSLKRNFRTSNQTSEDKKINTTKERNFLTYVFCRLSCISLYLYQLQQQRQKKKQPQQQTNRVNLIFRTFSFSIHIHSLARSSFRIAFYFGSGIFFSPHNFHRYNNQVTNAIILPLNMKQLSFLLSLFSHSFIHSTLFQKPEN